jgi:3-hydroxyacyl-CoA dehydrogenase
LDFLTIYGEKFLGKTAVVAKDTPAFIGNRVGIFWYSKFIPFG